MALSGHVNKGLPCGMAGLGSARQGRAGHGMVRASMAHGFICFRYVVRFGTARQGKAR